MNTWRGALDVFIDFVVDVEGKVHVSFTILSRANSVHSQKGVNAL
jgi:hypothetical protein